MITFFESGNFELTKQKSDLIVIIDLRFLHVSANYLLSFIEKYKML